MYFDYLLHNKNCPQLRGVKQHFALFVILQIKNSQRAWLGSSALNHVVSAETAGAEGSLLRWHLHSCLQPWCAWLCCLSLSFSFSASPPLASHPKGHFSIATWTSLQHGSLTVVGFPSWQLVLPKQSFQEWLEAASLLRSRPRDWHSIPSAIVIDPDSRGPAQIQRAGA